MKFRKAFKFRLEIVQKSEIEDRLKSISNTCRFLWNKACYMNLWRLHNFKRIMSYYELSYWLTHIWKKSEEYKFLNDCPDVCLREKLRDLETAFKTCFKKVKNRRLPKPKRKEELCSFKIYKFKVEDNYIKIPNFKPIRFIKSRDIIGTPRNITISYYCGHWYCSICVEYEKEEILHPSDKMVGVHMGIVNFATTSDGIKYPPLNSYSKEEKKLARLQKALSRKQKDSKNWLENKLKIQKIYEKIKNRRNDYIHKLSKKIADNNNIVVMEKLEVQKMSKSNKGTVENPGVHVQVKSGLNKKIREQGWYKFKLYVKYKQDILFGQVIDVNPAFDSQKCSKCGYIDKKNRKNILDFICQKCNYETHADINAAKNVLIEGHSKLARAEISGS